MPSSWTDGIETVIGVAWKLAPRSVFDVGAGSGKYGVLFREYLDARHRDENAAYTHSRATTIDGVEDNPAYIGDLHRAVYDTMFPMLIQDFLSKHGEKRYDLIYAGDVIEHLEKSYAKEIAIPQLLEMSGMGLLISVPYAAGAQGAVFCNELERHRSQWSAADFRSLAPFSHIGRMGDQLIAFLAKNRESVAKIKTRYRRRIKMAALALREGW